LREEGMTPYEIMLSESQERMLLVATDETEKRVREVFHKWDLDASVVGRVTGTGRVRVSFKGQVVADVPANALVQDAPLYRRPSARPAWQDGLAQLALASIKDVSDGTQALAALSTSLNLCSREEVYSEYDHTVRSNTVVRPGSDAAVIGRPTTR
ncbi:MAG: AIR synthase-related protein, partial [candidate division NC10 bacterium]